MEVRVYTPRGHKSKNGELKIRDEDLAFFSTDPAQLEKNIPDPTPDPT